MGFINDSSREDARLRVVVPFIRQTRSIFEEATAVLGGTVVEGKTPNICRSSGWTPQMLKRVAAMAAECGEADDEELCYATWLAVSDEWMTTSMLRCGMRNPDDGLKVQCACGIMVRRLDRWRKESSADQLPPAEYIGFFLAVLWDDFVTKHNYCDIANQIACGFPGRQLTMTQAQDVAGEYFHQQITPSVAVEMARRAIDVVTSGSGVNTGGGSVASMPARAV